MSTDAVAMFRNRLGPDLSALAEQHMKHEYVPPFHHQTHPHPPPKNLLTYQ